MNRWSKDSIVFAFRSYSQLYGDSPTVKACTHLEELPNPSTVKYHFGSLTRASEAAGIKPRGRGCTGHLLHPDCGHKFKHVKA